MRINPGLRLIRRSPSSIQIGLNRGLVLDGLTDSDFEFITSLQTRLNPRPTDLGERYGLTNHRVQELLRALEPVLLLEPPALLGLRADRLSGEYAQLSALHERAGTEVIARRGRSTVAVTGMDALTVAICTGLASAGIGALMVGSDSRDGADLNTQFRSVHHSDHAVSHRASSVSTGADHRNRQFTGDRARAAGIVTASQIGGSGFRLQQLGMGRFDALHQLVRAIDPQTKLHYAQETAQLSADLGTARADLIIMTARDELDDEQIRTADRAPCAVLPVIVRETDGVVGPLVVPRETSCLNCRALHLSDADPGWACVRDGLSTPSRLPIAATSASSAVAALAVVQALGYLDGVHQPSSWSTELVLRLADGQLTSRPCPPHDCCLCEVACNQL